MIPRRRGGMCESENEKHGDRGCPNVGGCYVATIYGVYSLCVTCAAEMPAEYLMTAARPAEAPAVVAAAAEGPAGRLCGTCRHYEAEDPIGGHCTDRPPNPMAAKSCGPSFGCVFHSAGVALEG